MLLTIHQLTKSYGDRVVLDHIDLTLDTGQRLGLVGANGVGKSTLLKIVAGEITADSGTCTQPPGVRAGYLPQTLALTPAETLGDLLDAAEADLNALDHRLRDLERQMATAADDLDAIMAEYGTALEAFERLGGYEREHRRARILSGLGLDHLPPQRAISTLSGGEQSRLGLAALLLQAPDLLLLDEPTNHLDQAALAWLESYLSGYQGAVLVVSHDREFLNQTVNAILEIAEHAHTATRYTGNYDDYLVAKMHARRRWEEEYQNQQAEIKALRQQIATSARQVSHKHDDDSGDKYLRFYRQTRVEGTVARRVKNARERLDRIEADPIPAPPKPLRFTPELDPDRLRAQFPLTVSNLGKRYGDRWVLREVSFTLDAHSRIVIVGPNGAGKSTLLKLIAGLETPDTGEVILNPQVTLGYLDQGQHPFAADSTVLDAYGEDIPGTRQHHISDLLAAGLFRYDDLRQPVGALSSGQQRKLHLARLIGQRANLLLLDEPTNYVSFDVLEALEDALRDFPGPVIAVSHDRRFIACFGGDVWALEEGRLMPHSAASYA